MARIDFTDAVGAASLASSWPAPADRFGDWTPFQRPIGEGAHGLGDGKRYQFSHRTDHGAAFEIRGIARTDADIALRLEAHLLAGGEVSVDTGDSAARVYPNCCLAPETTPEFEFADPVTLEYTLRLVLISLASPGAPMLCEY